MFFGVIHKIEGSVHKIIVILYLFFLALPVHAGMIVVDFDQSMHLDKNIQKNSLYKKLEQLYDRNNPNHLAVLPELTIPKKIHQIWLGPKPIPKLYKEYTKTWQALHPDWEYKLWREEDIASWDFASKDLFNKASSYQEKADILRYEILYKHGGLYVDMDYKAFKNFDELHHLYYFYASIEPMNPGDSNIYISNAIIGSRSDNIILKDALERIRKHWDSAESNFREEAKHKTKEKKGDIIYLAINRTMMPFNHAIEDNILSVDRAIVLPTTYLSIEIQDRFFDPFKRFFNMSLKCAYFCTIYPETMAAQDRSEHRVITNLSDITIDEPWRRTFHNWFRELFI